MTDQTSTQPDAQPTCGEVGIGWPNGSYAEPVDTEPCALPFDHEEPHDWAQREAAAEEIAKLREQLADAHAAGARSATQADQVREANTLLIADRHRLARDLDQARAELAAASLHRADFDRLAAELKRVRANGQAYLLWRDHTAAVASKLVDAIDGQGTTAGPGDLRDATNRMRNVLALDPEKTYFQPLGASPVRPGSSRPAQEDPLHVACAIEFFEEHGQPLNAAAVRDLQAERDQLRAAQADPSAPPPGWGYIARVDQLLQRVRPLIAGPVPVVSFAEIAEAADRVDAERAKLTPSGVGAAQGWDPTTPQWAVIRTAINWRFWYGDKYDPTRSSACNDLAAAVDELPHIGEQEPVETPEQSAAIVDANLLRMGSSGLDAEPEPDCAQDETQPARTARRLLDQAIDTALPEAGGRVRKLLKALRRELARVDAVRADPSGEPRADLPTYGDDAPGTLRSRP